MKDYFNQIRLLREYYSTYYKNTLLWDINKRTAILLSIILVNLHLLYLIKDDDWLFNSKLKNELYFIYDILKFCDSSPLTFIILII